MELGSSGGRLIVVLYKVFKCSLHSGRLGIEIKRPSKRRGHQAVSQFLDCSPAETLQSHLRRQRGKKAEDLVLFADSEWGGRAHTRSCGQKTERSGDLGPPLCVGCGVPDSKSLTTFSISLNFA